MPFCLIGVNVAFICYQTFINLLWKGIKTNKRLPPIKQSMRVKNSGFKIMKMVGLPKLKDSDYCFFKFNTYFHLSYNYVKLRGKNLQKQGKVATRVSHDRLCLVMA